ncbi:MAG TPA: hypothetical protein VNR38_22390 [Ureibacillus sp.]|nr:hypothetical protein [Ureibacillus sp.]
MLNDEGLIIEKQTNAAATVSFSNAVLGFFLSLIPFVGWVFAPIWMIAILFGMVGLVKGHNRRLAVYGILLGMFTFAYKIVLLQLLNNSFFWAP